MFYMDPTYILVLLGVVITLIAQSKLKSTYANYSRKQASCGMTGAQVAQMILRKNGIYDVSVGHINGTLTDHYDPKKKLVNLSDATYAQTSIAAISVAAHECGHAIQDNTEYAPLKIRTIFAPVANIGAKLAWPLILAGFFLGMLASNAAQMGLGNGTSIGGLLMQIGVFAYLLAVVFQFLTLPVEYNASKRAENQLSAIGIIADNEKSSVKSVLDAAALTYVAGTAASALQFLRIFMLFGGRGNNRR